MRPCRWQGLGPRGSDGCGVQLHPSFAELREVAFEECPTGITELGVQPASHIRRDFQFSPEVTYTTDMYTTRRSRKKSGPPKNTPEKTHNRISAAPRGSDNMDTIQSPRIDEGIRACIHPGCHDLIVHQAHRPRIFFTRPRRGGTRRSSAWARRSRRGSAPAQVNGGRKPPLLLMGPPPTARRAPRRQPRSRARCPR